MSKLYIKNGNVISKERIINGASVYIDGSKIASIGKNIKPSKGSFIVDAKNCFVSPGFIDCHIHGEPEKIFFNEARHGMTSFVVAQSCASLESIYKRAGKIKEFINKNPFGENVLGLRLEGPYINQEKAGAQNKAYIKNPDMQELMQILQGCKGLLKIMTVAPELIGIKPILRTLCKNGVIPSIGHSDATYESAIDGIDAGIRHATHTFNAMSPLDRRSPGVIGAILLDNRVTAEIILDLVHVHRALFALLIKAKTKDRVIVITDSIVSSPHKDTAQIGGAYRFDDGRLAGSALNMIEALKNAVTKCNLSLLEALRLITLNPARFLGVDGKKGSIETGKDADIVIFDKNFDVKATIICGRIAYEKKGFICAA
ncbi:MAG: N-acetylglucosamine-6-phosphate deacetylase [Candidatus Omnitrophota bacterium]|nr:N-acetylglucosamine-6-phosphate deacetylase [Candidatus Omnitrophota bacterium]